MIEIIEKEPYFDDSPFTGNCYMYPTYMVKDGEEHFMFNRREPDSEWNKKAVAARVEELKANGGRYMRFNGIYADPEEMLKEIRERKHTFTYDKLEEIMHWLDVESFMFCDFHGNRREVSASFFYRIYDMELAERIKAQVIEILEGRC